MRQAEIQIGGVYVSKGAGMRKGKRVRVVGLVPASGEHPAKVKLEDLDSGKATKPNVTSFQNAYNVESLPHQPTDFKKLTERRGNGGPSTPPTVSTRELLDDMKLGLKTALAALEQLGERLGDE